MSLKKTKSKAAKVKKTNENATVTAKYEVRRWTAPDKGTAISSVLLLPDDSISTVRAKLSAAFGLSDPADLAMWTVDASAVGAADLAAEALGGSRTATEAQVLAFAAGACGDASLLLNPSNNRRERTLTLEQATALLSSVHKNGRRVRSVGARLLLGGTGGPFGGADPFAMLATPAGRALLRVPDADLVGPDGRPRAGTGRYVLSLEGESDLLEDVVGMLVLNVATRDDVTRALATALNVSNASDASKNGAFVHGVVGRFFALATSGGHAVSATVYEHADASALALASAVAESRSLPRIHADATLSNVTARMPRSAHSTHSSDPDVLFELFAGARTSPEVPCVKVFDGTTTTFKLHAGSLKDGSVPPAKARQWAAPETSARQKPFLQAYCLVNGSHLLATLVVRADFAAHVQISGFGRLGVDRAAQVEGIRRAAEAVDRLLVAPLQAELARADLPHVLPLASAHVADGKMTFAVDVHGGDRTPSPAQLASTVIERLGAFFSVVSMQSGKLVLSYRRAKGAGKRERASLAVRLMASRPREEVLTELQSTFGMGAAEALSFYRTHAPSSSPDADPDRPQQPSDFAELTYRMELVPIIKLEPTGRLGYRAEIYNVTRFAYLDRITTLLRLLVAEAHSSGGLLARMPLMPRMPSLEEAFKAADAVVSRRSVVSRPSDVSDVDAQYANANADDELDALIEEELGSKDHEETGGKKDAAAEESGVAENDDDGGAMGSELPEQYMLTLLKRADRALFRSNGQLRNEYSTHCAHNSARQPIVVTRDELARIDREFPGSHTGALVGYGTTPEAAANNAYICPKVWCPRSKVALSEAQFEKLGRKCPYKGVEETPILFESDYFPKGRDRHIGMLDARKHPQNFCAPCCYLKPAQRLDQCAPATLQLPLQDETKKEMNKNKKAEENEKEKPAEKNGGDPRYIRGDVAPLEEGRYGMLPASLATAMGTRPKSCGNRDDGSGQIKVHSRCFVRRGVRMGPQPFLECAARVLGHPDGPSLTALVVRELSAAELVTLDGGRTVRHLMDGLDPVALVEDPEFRQGMARWLLDEDRAYATRYAASVAPVAAAISAAGWDRKGGRSSTIRPDAVVGATLREALVRGALLRFRARMADPAETKTHDSDLGLLDLFSRPLPWLNPHRVNLLLFERKSGSSSSSSFVACPRGDDPTARWRLSDPVSIVMRQGGYYEPVVHVSLGRRGVREVARFVPAAHPRLAAAVRQYLTSCSAGTPAGRGHDALAAAVNALAIVGRPARAQVVDCFFRAVGLVASDGTFVPLMTPPSPPLVGAVGAGLEVVYVSDVGSGRLRPRLDAKAASALFARLAETTGNAGLRPDLSSPSSIKTLLRLANGGFVPLKGHANANGDGGDDHYYLDHLNALVRVRADPDERSRLADARASKADLAWELRSRVVRKIRADVDLTAEVEALRSSLHPLPLEGRRAEARRIVLGLGVKADTAASDLVEMTVDALLFDLHPWSLRRDTRVDDGGGASLVLTDFEVASGALELAMAVVGQQGAVVGQGSPALPSADQQQKQGEEVPQEQQEQQQGEDDAWNSNLGNKKMRTRNGRRLLPMPLDEPTLARAVSHAQVQVHGHARAKADTFSSSEPSNPSSHRSRAYLAQQPTLVPQADAYLALHLAHRELRSDAPASLQDAVRFVQDAVLSVDVALIRDGTLGRMVQQKQKHKQDRAVRGSPWGLRADLADAIARRRTWSSSASSYVTSTFELEALSRFLGVEVVVVRAPASDNKKKSARKSASTNRWLLEAAEARNGSSSPFVMLVLREDGLGHDLALAPAPEAGAVREAGHTILWRQVR
jgi:hypothetical protein